MNNFHKNVTLRKTQDSESSIFGNLQRFSSSIIWIFNFLLIVLSSNSNLFINCVAKICLVCPDPSHNCILFCFKLNNLKIRKKKEKYIYLSLFYQHSKCVHQFLTEVEQKWTFDTSFINIFGLTPLINTFYCIVKLRFFMIFKLGKILFYKKIQTFVIPPPMRKSKLTSCTKPDIAHHWNLSSNGWPSNSNIRLKIIQPKVS